MKKISTALVIFIFTALSCTKDNSNSVNPKNIPEDFGCMNRVYTTAGDSSAVKPSDYKTAMQLLQLVNSSTGNLRIITVVHDTIQKEVYLNIDAEQYVNGLPVFNDDMRFGFKNSVLNSSNGTIVTSCGLDTVPVLKPTQVRTLFVSLLTSRSSGAMFASFKDSCLVTEFGYYNTNVNSNNPTVNLVKAWFVHPQNSEFPFAYIKDNGATLEYITGIVL